MESNQTSNDQIEEITDEFENTLKLEDQDEDEDDEDDDDDFEFFIGHGEMSSPVSAEEIFLNGQIRPIFPFSGEIPANSDDETTSYGPPVRKLFVVSSSGKEEEEEENDVAEGPYCAWSSEKSPEKSTAPEMSRKSNSTGFSKLRKVRDLLVRSNSDGKDAFVFFTGKNGEKVETMSFRESKKKKKKKEDETVSFEKGKKSAYEVFYGKREKKVGKSYLPYRQELVGFFTNANAMSRNVHPY